MAVWSDPKTWAAEPLVKEDLNQYIRDNQNFLKSNVAWGAATELTISSGAVTKTQSYHKIDTEGDAASDDLDTINGGSEGEVQVIRSVSSARVVRVRTGMGNIEMTADVILDEVGKMLTLIHDGTNWQALNYPKEDIVGYGAVGHCHAGRVKAA